MTTPTALSALPPSVGDAPVAAVLLRDLAADLAADRPGHVDPARVEVDDDGRFHLRTGAAHGSVVDLEHASLAAPELFGGAVPDARSDVYAAACLALTRYLGVSPVPAPALGARPTASARLAAVRLAQRTTPARLGALPAPFRAVFARAVAKERHLRPTPAVLVAELDAAFATLGGDAAARTRVHRLIVLARVFEPGTGSDLRTPPAVAAAASAPLHLPIRSLPALRPSRHAARVALIAAVTVVATGGVAVAAVVGLSSGSPNPTPQAIETLTSPTPPTTASSPSASPVASTSSAAPAPATTSAPAAVVPVGNSGQGGSGSGSGSGSGRSAATGGSSHGSGAGTARSSSAGSGHSATTSQAPAPSSPTAASTPPSESSSAPESTPPASSPRPTVSGTTSAPPTSASPSASSPAVSSADPSPSEASSTSASSSPTATP